MFSRGTEYRCFSLVKLENILIDQNTKIHYELTNCLNNMSEDFDINKLHVFQILLII